MSLGEPSIARRRAIAAAVLAAVVVLFELGRWWTGGHALASAWWSDAWWTLISLAAGARCLRTARRQRERHLRWAWRCFGLAALSWFLGMLKWDFDELGRRHLTPFPSVADVGFLATPVLLVVGYFAYKKRQPSNTLMLRYVADLGVVGCVLVMVSSLLLYAPALQYADSSIYVFTALAYPILHLTALLFGLICLWQHVWGANRQILSIHLAGLGCLAAVTTLYASSLLLHRYHTGNALDVGWVLTFALLYWSAEEEGRTASLPVERELRGVPHLDAVVPAMAVGGLALAGALCQEWWIAPLEPIWIVAGLGLGVALGLRTFANHQIERTLSDEVHREQERRRLAEAALFEAQKLEAVGALAGGVAHEFKNLLTSMAAGVTLARRQLAKKQDAGQALELVEHAVWRASDVTTRLLDLSRRREPALSEVSPALSLERLVPLLAQVLPSSIAIRWTPPSAPGASIRVDEALLEQALLNLALNARDAMSDRGGELSFVVGEEVRAARRFATISVHDTGEGIPPEVQAHLFEPFFTTKPAGKGTGFGLAMVRAFADEHGGWVEVQSEPHRGATFTIGLPTTPPTDFTRSAEAHAG